MNRVIEDWKRFLATKHGVGWQRGYSDHRIRSENDMTATWHYITQNPVKAGLVEAPEEWTHVWRPKR